MSHPHPTFQYLQIEAVKLSQYRSRRLNPTALACPTIAPHHGDPAQHFRPHLFDIRLLRMPGITLRCAALSHTLDTVLDMCALPQCSEHKFDRRAEVLKSAFKTCNRDLTGKFGVCFCR